MNKTNHFLEIGSSHKKLAVGISGAVVAVLAVGGVGFASMNSHPVPKTTQSSAQASNNHKPEVAKVKKLQMEMEKEKSDSKKLEDLKQIELKYQKYEKNATSYKKLTDAYKDAIHSGKAYFLNKTNKIIQNLTPKDINKENNANNISGKIKSLQGQLKFVNDNQESVFSKDNVDNYTKQINGLIKQYQNRAKKLAEQKKAEESKKANQSSQAQSSSQNQQSQQSQQAQNQQNGQSQAQSSSVAGSQNQSNSYSQSSNSSQSQYQGSRSNSYGRGQNASSYRQPSSNYKQASQASQPSRSSSPANNGSNNHVVVFHGWTGRDDGSKHYWTSYSNGNTKTVHQDGYGDGTVSVD